jgi:hypothetical protein
MKTKFFLLLFLLSYNCVINAQGKRHTYNFILKGHVVGKHTHSLHMRYIDGYGKTLDQKVYIKNGSFVVKGYISSPVCAGILNDIKINPNNHADISNYVDVFLSPGDMTISLKENDFEHAKIKGSIMQKDWEELKINYQPITKIKDSLYTEMFKVESAGNTLKSHAAHVIIVNKIDSCNNLENHINYKFISLHPNSYVSAYLLKSYFEGREIKLDSAEMFYKNFTPSVKNSVAGKSVYNIIMNRKASAVGSMVIWPSGIDLNGKKLNLKSFINKGYVILYFWADWSNRGETKRLNQLYKKYHPSGLDVISISIDPFKKFWKDEIAKDSIGMWHNMLSNGVSNLDTFYNISSMAPPLFLLVDKKGEIIGRYRGADIPGFSRDFDEAYMDDLDKKLIEIFDK